MRRESGGRRWAAMTAVAGTVFIAAGAFWLSFTSLADLAARSGIGVGQAWAWPLIVDGIIVVATVAVVALAGQRRPTWYPWTLLAAGAVVSVTANAIHAIIAADTDVPSVLAASVAAIPPLVLLAITHLTVILTRPASEAAKPHLADEDEPTPESGLSELQAVIPTPGSEQTPAREVAGRLRDEEGWSNKAIARPLGVHPSTVGRWFARPELTTRDEQETP